MNSINHAIAFVFSGQGSQQVGMLASLSEQYPAVREAFIEASDDAGTELWARTRGGPEEMLNRTEFTRPTLIASGVAVWQPWQAANGLSPSQLAGDGLGEDIALVAAGAISLGAAEQLGFEPFSNQIK